MTAALCLNCGEMRTGAITHCSNCGYSGTGNFGLDITFSDHRLSDPTLRQLGSVIRTIARTHMSSELRLYTFMQYVVENYPRLGVTTNFPVEIQTRVSSSLRSLGLPIFDLELSQECRILSGEERIRPQPKPPQAVSPTESFARVLGIDLRDNSKEIAMLICRYYRNVSDSVRCRSNPLMEPELLSLLRLTFRKPLLSAWSAWLPPYEWAFEVLSSRILITTEFGGSVSKFWDGKGNLERSLGFAEAIAFRGPASLCAFTVLVADRALHLEIMPLLQAPDP